jgi:cysteine desulfurase
MEIYFDHNSTTKVYDSVLAKMNEVYALPLNSSSSHRFGQKANTIIENTRSAIKQELNGGNYEIIFTSCATESNNLAIFGCGAEEFFFSGIEHSSIYNTCNNSSKKTTEISTDENGIIQVFDLENQLKNIAIKNFLVSGMLANNETGAIQPIKEMAKITHQNSGLFHSDIAQAFGKITVDLEDLNVDLASISSHKINGPQGCGALLIRKGIEINPMIFGGGQEKRKRSGTLNIAGIAGFCVAINNIKSRVEKLQKTAVLRDFLENEMEKIAGENLKIFSKNAERLANTSFSAIKNSNNQAQLINFDLNEIYVSAGSACSSGTLNVSKVLQAMNVEKEFLSGAIRISLGEDNSLCEIKKFLEVWKNFYDKRKQNFHL